MLHEVLRGLRIMLLSEDNRHAPETETIRSLFALAVRDHGAKNLIVSDVDGSVFTYADAAIAVRRIMAKLRAEGLTKGDRLCLYSPVRVESFLVFWAAASLGVVVVPLDHHWPERLLERVLGQIRPKLFFCERRSFLGFEAVKETVRTVLFDEPRESCPPGPPVLSQWLDGDVFGSNAPELHPDDAAVILYTSGSTGDPKGVVLSHGALYRSGRLVRDLFDWRSDDILLSLGDMHAMSGLRNPGTATLHAGCSFLMTAPALRSNLFALAECIRKHRCTQLSTVPAAIRELVQFKDRIPASSLGSLRSVQSAGSVLTQPLLDAFWEHFHVPVLNYYGLTETTGLCIGHSLQSFRQANGSIGLPVGCIAEIVDADGHAVADGSAGELRIKSGNLLSGYYGNAELTKTILRNGWFSTGDLAVQRPDGHIVLTGRKKNIIKQANGDLVSLEEVESALEKHPQVREAAVCGFTSARGDERMAAFLVTSSLPGHEPAFIKEIRQHVARELGPHKVPAVYYLRERLPRNSMGKLLREQLKQDIVEP